MAKKRILIADDERAFVYFLKENLIQKGYLVDVAYDGEDALELIKSNMYDAMFLDHNMPEMTGLELAKYVKEKNIKSKVVIVTGYDEMSESFAKIAGGADEYLTKPVKTEDIEKIIEGKRGGDDEKDIDH